MKIDITKEQWIKIRAQGKYKYILFHWIITVALPLSIVLPVLRALINRNFVFIQFVTNVIINVAVFSVISIIFGMRRWKKYSKMLN